MAFLSLTVAACNSGTGSTTEASGSSTDTDTTSTSGPTSGTEPTSSGTGTTSTGTGTDSDSTGSTTQTVDPPTGTTDSTSTTDPGTSTGTDTDTTDSTSTTDGTSTTDTTDSSTTDSTSSTTDTGSSSDTNGCVPTEDTEVTCDKIDNDCDGNIDNVDLGKDGICDCLSIGILGDKGYAPNSNFEMWLESKGTSVTRTLLANNPGVVTPALLANYDLVLLDRIERQLDANEAAALESFVKDSNGGLITLIGYNFDNGNPAPERDRANTALEPFGLRYTGGYFGDNQIPTFDQAHPIGMGIMQVRFLGGIRPEDFGNLGTSEVFATVLGQDAGIAHQTDMGGRIIVWGDEWITFDSEWMNYEHVDDFWVNMVDWARPQNFCLVPM